MTSNIQNSFAAAVGGRAAFASSFSVRTMRNLEQRANRELADAEATVVEAFAKIDRAARRHKLEDPDAIAKLKGEWLGRYRSAWTAFQHAGARTANWMVTGPARFPVERNRKRMETEHKRLEEMLAIANGAEAWAEKRIKRQIREELGPVGVADHELEAAKAKLAAREHRQAMMKAANAAVRKHKGDAEAIRAAIEAAGFTEAKVLASAMSKGGLLHVGFESWQLSNNSAEIRRMRDRVAQLERRAAAVSAAAELEPVELEESDAPRIVENVLDQRLQIFFPDKPSAELRSKLKGRGFRWAPSAGAWQRQLTNNARHAAAEILAAAA